MNIDENDAFVVVDAQNDFVTGSFSVPGAENIIEPLNIAAAAFKHVLVVVDWHPADHISFSSNHPGTKPWDIVQAQYGPQPVYVDHCVQGTWGAELDPRLELTKAEVILRKGYRSCSDSLSAFYEADGTATGLGAYAKSRGFRRLFFSGLGRYGCVLQSALGAAKDGFEVYMVHDATWGDIDVEKNDRLIEKAGIRWLKSFELLAQGPG